MKCDYSNRQAILAKFKRSFSDGVGSILSLQGGKIELPTDSRMSDAEQLRSDWEVVGSELTSAYESQLDKYAFSPNHGHTRK